MAVGGAKGIGKREDEQEVEPLMGIWREMKRKIFNR